MIFYLVTPAGLGTQVYVNAWGSSPNSRMRYLLYDDLQGMQAIERGTYLFTDLERLSPAQMQMARRLWSTLARSAPPVRTVNDPSRVQCRLELLQRLHDAGINRFRALRASEPAGRLAALRYPVFIREEKEHTGNISTLLPGAGALARELRRLLVKGYYAKDLLVVEFCDTSDACGIFRKYSAFRIAGKVVPRHVLFSRRWNQKTPDLVDAPFMAERDAYLETNPHEARLRTIFDLAGIDYGRIDYSVLDGELQVWEINSNPNVRKITPRLTEGFEALDDSANGSDTIPWSVGSELDRELRREQRRRSWTRWHRGVVKSARSRLSFTRAR